MASRSTRQKIRDQGKKMLCDFERIYEHLQYLDQLADGRSDYINNNLSPLITIISISEEAAKEFFNGL